MTSSDLVTAFFSVRDSSARDSQRREDARKGNDFTTPTTAFPNPHLA